MHGRESGFVNRSTVRWTACDLDCMIVVIITEILDRHVRLVTCAHSQAALGPGRQRFGVCFQPYFLLSSVRSVLY